MAVDEALALDALPAVPVAEMAFDAVALEADALEAVALDPAKVVADPVTDSRLEMIELLALSTGGTAPVAVAEAMAEEMRT